MNRKEFLERVVLGSVLWNAAAVVGVQGQPTVRQGGSGPSWRKGRRRVTDWASEIAARPEQVFPLLCPAREYEWLEGWTAEMIYSESGVAEADCVFATDRGGERATWAVSRYEPPTRIEFVHVTPDVLACRLIIALEPIAGGARLRWTRVFTSLGERGHHAIDAWTTARDQALSEKIEHFVRTGVMKAGG